MYWSDTLCGFVEGRANRRLKRGIAGIAAAAVLFGSIGIAYLYASGRRAASLPYVGASLAKSEEDLQVPVKRSEALSRRGDATHNAVLAFLRMNLQDPYIEEVEWLPEAVVTNLFCANRPEQQLVSWCSVDSLRDYSLHSLPRNLVDSPSAVVVALHYRTRRPFGVLTTLTGVFLIDNNGCVYAMSRTPSERQDRDRMLDVWYVRWYTQRWDQAPNDA